MIRERIPETNEGIQEHITVEIFDSFARFKRDKGWNNVDVFFFRQQYVFRFMYKRQKIDNWFKNVFRK